MTLEIQEFDQNGLRNFAWVFAALVVGLFGLLLPFLFNWDWSWEPWLIGGVFFTWGLFAPRSLRPFYRFWMQFVSLINSLMTRLVLGVVFYALILPYGVVFRLRGRDAMHRNWEHSSSTYRRKSPKMDPKHMEKPY